MNENNKIEIAKRYMNLHKNANDWHEGIYDDKGYLDVYSNLENEVYGEVKTDFVSCDYAIEIGSTESNQGHAVIFEWDD